MAEQGQEKRENLWLSLLGQASTRVLTPEATCIVLGEQSCDKAALLSALAQQQNVPNALSQLELINYNYVDVDDTSLVTPTKLHMWQLDEKMLPFAKKLLSDSLVNHPVMFVVALDMTTGDQVVDALKKWLALLATHIQELRLLHAEEVREAMKAKHLQYLLSARLHKGSSAAAASTSDVAAHDELSGKARYQFAVEAFAVPIVVVGCKLDQLDTSSALAVRSLREVQGRLRGLCLEAGAALAFVSTAAEAEAEATIQHLRKYILHRLYPENLGMELKVEDAAPVLFVPAGFDTVDLIQVTTGVKPDKEALQQHMAAAVQFSSAKETLLAKPAFVTIESEQDWLLATQALITKFAVENAALKSSNNLMDALQAEADAAPGIGSVAGSAAPTQAPERRRPDPIAASAGSGKESVSAPPTKRSSIIRSVAATDKKDVGDFFKNLMESKPKK